MEHREIHDKPLAVRCTTKASTTSRVNRRLAPCRSTQSGQTRAAYRPLAIDATSW